ncbi:SRPBCC family protein [Actinoplanes sp. NPDC051494]|uniref:SRPBCC family protein n=1 Tax=Actinoplanes sp. NPDC051494 TaxID=3363907 RepID=UPI003797FCE0
MASETRHLAVPIDRPAADVYAYAADPRNIPEWAPGLGTSVELVDGVWFVEGPGGRVRLDPAPPNEYLVLDHTVTLPAGDSITNQLRVLTDGDGSDITFALRRQPGMTDDEWAADIAAVLADLNRLKQITESAA